MKHTEIQPQADSPLPRSGEKDLSRRKFLQSAAVAGMAVVTIPIAGIAQTGTAERQTNPKDPMEQILSRYGSEFGDLKRIG